MTVFRLSSEKYKYDLSGKGAEHAGGRWNSKSVALVYTSETRALCVTEIAVHTPLGIVPKNYYLITIEIPESVEIKVIKPTSLPECWNDIPYGYQTQQIGNKFIQENKYAVLKVPSAVVAGDWNYLLNPDHCDFRLIKIKHAEKFEFDKRLFTRTNAS